MPAFVWIRRWRHLGGVKQRPNIVSKKLPRRGVTNELPRREANYAPLTPLIWLERAAKVYKDDVAIVDVDGSSHTWATTRDRCVALAGAIASCGLGRGDVVQVMLDNTREMCEAHFGVPMSGATLGCVNTRLDAAMIAFILRHSEARLFLYDSRHRNVAERAIQLVAEQHGVQISGVVVGAQDDVEATRAADGDGSLVSYERVLATQGGSSSYAWRPPEDEWDTIALNYTSGTTGDPKGVLGSHRGAYLAALGNSLAFNGLPSRETRYLWTLPMFHCNGWTFPYTLAAVGGANICLRSVTSESIARAFEQHDVTHFCGAPIVLRMAIDAARKLREKNDGANKSKVAVKMMVAAAPPPPAVLREAEAAGIDVTHVYGLTEVYGPAAVNEWHPNWRELGPEAAAKQKAKQGVEYATCDAVDVHCLEKGSSVPADGETLGEVVFKGNMVMKGYLKNDEATELAFRDGWFRSGDVAIKHSDNYLAVKDRAKDVVISGGENISTIEVQDALLEHPDVLEAAVVPRPDDKWGEHPAAFVELKSGASLSAKDLVAFSRTRLAGFKVPKTVVFGPLPKTSTGKIQKFLLRDKIKALDDPTAFLVFSASSEEAPHSDAASSPQEQPTRATG